MTKEKNKIDDRSRVQALLASASERTRQWSKERNQGEELFPTPFVFYPYNNGFMKSQKGRKPTEPISDNNLCITSSTNGLK